jgi:hypothetical protein
MPRLAVSVKLPYALRLRAESYRVGPLLELIRVENPPSLAAAVARTVVQAEFDHAETDDADEKQRLRVRDAEQLLRRTNRLLRWYRAVSRKTDIVELTRAQASPFEFQVLGEPAGKGWEDPINYEAAGPTPAPLSLGELT